MCVGFNLVVAAKCKTGECLYYAFPFNHFCFRTLNVTEDIRVELAKENRVMKNSKSLE